MTIMKRSEAVSILDSRRLVAVPDHPAYPGSGYSTSHGQSLDVGNIRGPINWTWPVEDLLAVASEVGKVLVED